ncbi:hypothetical protein D030_0254A, partial [Vibrio parahaemolyticus AQ3810]
MLYAGCPPSRIPTVYNGSG